MESLSALLSFPLPSVIIVFLLLLIFSSFLKLSVTFSILFLGLGLSNGSGKLMAFALALSLSFLALGSDLEKSLDDAKFNQANSEQEKSASLIKFAASWKHTIEKSVSVDAKEKIIKVLVKKDPTIEHEQNSWAVLAPAFVISELQKALTSGFKILLPFLVIDLVIGYIFTALDIKSMNSQILAFPLKLLAFISVDGLGLITGSILNSLSA